MSIIIAWITNIILLILFATILELLLPNSKMQRYVKLVVGLMLLMVMLQPLLSIFQTDPEEWLSELTSWTENSTVEETSLIDSKKMDIERETLAYISEQVAVQLKDRASEELEKHFEVVPLDVHITFEPFQDDVDLAAIHYDWQTLMDNLSEVYILLVPKSEQEDQVETIEIVTIEPVKIEQEDLQDEDEWVSSTKVTGFLSTLWEIPEDKIHVQMKGGEE